MDQDRLDEFIKKQVESLETSTDPDLLWQEIQAKQAEEKKPKRRFFFFWLLGGALLLSGLALFYIIGFPNIEDGLSNDISSKKENIIDEKASINNTPKNQVADKNIKNTDLSIVDLSEQHTNNKKVKESTLPSATKPVDSNEVIPTTNSTESSKTARKETLKATPPTTNNLDFNNENNIDQKKKLNQIPANNNLETKQKITKNPEQKTPQILGQTPQIVQEKTEIDLPVTPLDSTNTDLGKEEVTSSKKEEITTNTATPKNGTNDALVTIPEKEVAPSADTTSTLNKPTIDSNFVDSLKEPTDGNPSQKIDQSDEKKWAFSNGASFVYGRGLRILSNQNSAPQNYVQTRKDSETTLDAIRAKIDFRLENRNGFYLQSGLEYEQINERFDFYREREVVEPVDDQLLAIFYAMDGSTSQLFGTKEVELTSWLRKKTFNRYSRIDVPILLGYHSTKKEKRLGWFVEGGISMNFWFKAKGEILDINDELLTFEDQTDLFKKRTGISLLGAAGLTYRITNKISLSASPEVKYNLNSITNSNQPLKQKYVNIGLGLGIRYHW